MQKVKAKDKNTIYCKGIVLICHNKLYLQLNTRDYLHLQNYKSIYVEWTQQIQALIDNSTCYSA